MEQRKIEPQLSEEERRLRQIELNRPTIDLINSWIEEDLAHEPTEEERALAERFMREIDAERPERPLFQEYYGR